MRRGKSFLTAQLRNPSRDWSGNAAIWEVSSVVHTLKIWARYLRRGTGTESNHFKNASRGVITAFLFLFLYLPVHPDHQAGIKTRIGDDGIEARRGIRLVKEVV